MDKGLAELIEKARQWEIQRITKELITYLTSHGGNSRYKIEIDAIVKDSKIVKYKITTEQTE